MRRTEIKSRASRLSHLDGSEQIPSHTILLEKSEEDLAVLKALIYGEFSSNRIDYKSGGRSAARQRRKNEESDFSRVRTTIRRASLDMDD